MKMWIKLSGAPSKKSKKYWNFQLKDCLDVDLSGIEKLIHVYE